MSITTPSVYALEAYGNDAYGDCAYSEGCTNSTQPPTVVDVPPSNNNQQSGRAFAINITDGQVFGKGKYQVIFTPNFPTDQIDRVEFYQGKSLVGSTSQAENGVYAIGWALPKNGGYQVRAVMYLTDGSKIEKLLNVSVNKQKATNPNNAKVDSDKNSGDSESTVTPALAGANKFFNKLPNWLQKLTQKTPRQIAYSLPYLLLGLLAGLLLVFLYQIRNQLQYITVLLKLVERDKQLVDEKANFIMLASHYVRTPLTILGGTVDLVLMDSPDEDDINNTKAVVTSFHSKAEQILSDIESNKDLNSIAEPDLNLVKRRLYSSFALLAPIILSLLVIVAVNLLYISAQKTHLIVPNVVVQIVLFVLASSLFYSLFRRHLQQKEQQTRLSQQHEYELALDKARNQFIERSASELTPLAHSLRDSFEQINSLAVSPQVTSALGQLDSLINRFVLVTQLERGKIESSVSKFNIDDIIKQTTDGYKADIETKNQNLTLQLKRINIEQNQLLLQYVLSIVVDNAVKFTPSKGKIHITSTQKSKNKVMVSMRNSGVDIDSDKLDRLFKPFSRSEDAEVFNEGGAGLSLYLARLIMRYLDGSISLNSANKATVANIVLPKKIS